MDTPYHVEPSGPRSGLRPLSYDIVHHGEGVLCSTADQVFAYKLVDLLNADVRKRADSDPQPS